ncbi:MAG: TolC family protein [Bacteroidetes bacterium]|jgi:cobalt-zinc-cadmium efflux system outer membrane protein|nr:TolC family protein [Bacteroidota bacterium]
MTLLVLFSLLLSLQVADSEPTDTNDLGVQEALEIAYQQNPKINQLTYQIRAQKQNESLTIGLEKPEVSYFREGIGEGSFTEQRWSISQQIKFPLTSIYQNRVEHSVTLSLEEEMNALQLSVKAEVKSAYTRLAYSIRMLRLAQERVELFQNLRRAAEARSEIGESSQIDAIQADLQLRESQNNLEVANRQFMDARYDLFQTIGLGEEDQIYDITFPDTLQYMKVDIDQELVMQRLEKHPVIKSVEMERESKEFQKKATKSSYLPDLNFSYYRQNFGNQYDFYGFEVGVQIPLWFGLDQSKRVKRANAMVEEVEWKLRDKSLLLKKMAEQSWHGFETSRENILRFRETIQSQSVDLINMTQTGYRMGELDLLTLLEAQRTYLRTQESYYQTLRDYYLRIIELERFMQEDIIFKQ